MLRHWRKLEGNRQAIQAAMKKELDALAGERAIFHDLSKVPLRKGRIDKAHEDGRALYIVDEKTREVYIVPVEYITQIGDKKLPRLKPLAMRPAPLATERDLGAIDAILAACRDSLTKKAPVPKVMTHVEAARTYIANLLKEGRTSKCPAKGLPFPAEVGKQIENDMRSYGNAFIMIEGDEWCRVDPCTVEIDGHEIVVGESSPEATEARKKELDAVRPLSEPSAKIVFLKTGESAASIEASRCRLMKELDALPQEVKDAYAGTEIDLSLFGTLTIKGAELETFHLENLDGQLVGDLPVLFGMFLMRLQNLVWERSQRRPDLLVVSTDVLAQVVQVKGYQSHDEGPESHGKKLVGVLPRHGLSVIVNNAFKVGTGCVRCIDPALTDVWEKFLVRLSRSRVHVEREAYEALVRKEEEDRPGVLHPCGHWYAMTCMCKGACGCHWEKDDSLLESLDEAVENAKGRSCSLCDGAKEVIQHNATGIGSRSTTTCPVCNGTGKHPGP